MTELPGMGSAEREGQARKSAKSTRGSAKSRATRRAASAELTRPEDVVEEQWELLDAVRERRDAEDAAEAGETPKRAPRKGFSAAREAGAEALRRVAGKRGVAETRLLTHWREIAGPELGEATMPVRVARLGGHSLGGALILAVEGPRASEVELAAPQLVERVNAFYGYAAIAEIKLTQTATITGPDAPERPRGARIEDLPEPKRDKLTSMTGGIRDGALRSALERLGANVMNKPPAS